jgi:carboxymethylenebutenolidase
MSELRVPGAVTDPSTVSESSVTVTAEDGHRLPLHVARPAQAAGPLPGLVVIHEAFGVNDHIRDVTRRFAAQGFLAAAPDLFLRGGPPPAPGAEITEIMRRVGAMSDVDAVADLRATVDRLRSEPGCNGRIGSIGFCMGGRLSLLLATHEGVLDRAVDCWGGRITRRTAPPDDRRPEVVVERVDRLACPLLGVFGAEDPNPDAGDIDELRAALEASGREHRIVVYPAAGHAFFADYRPSWREEPAHAAWAEFLRFLEPLKGQQGEGCQRRRS